MMDEARVDMDVFGTMAAVGQLSTYYNESPVGSGDVMSTPVLSTSSTPTLAHSTWEAAFIVIVCSVIVVGTVVGNVLVCMAVSIVRKLRTPSNWLIVSLAVSDLLVALLVMPLAVVDELYTGWLLGTVLCDIWTSLDVLLCTASILNLCMISIDRYLVITRPFQYAVKRTPLLMAGMIVAVWVVAALISIPPVFGWKSQLPEYECHVSQEIGYQLYATIGAFYLPLVVMIVIYARIYAVSKRITVAEARSKPSFAIGATRRRGSSFATPSDGGSGPASGNFRRPSENVPATNSKNSLEVNSGGIYRHSLTGSSFRQTNASAGDCNNHTYAVSPSEASGGGGLRKKVSFLHRQVHRLPSAAKDTKATKTLGVIMGAFTMCWLPFFILALIRPFCAPVKHHVTGEPISDCIPGSLSSVFLWLGFTNSFLNPIIYARFNRDFRTPFKEILLCRCRNIDRRLRSESYVEQYGGGGGGGGGAGLPHSPTGRGPHSPAFNSGAAAGNGGTGLNKTPSFVLTVAPDDLPSSKLLTTKADDDLADAGHGRQSSTVGLELDPGMAAVFDIGQSPSSGSEATVGTTASAHLSVDASSNHRNGVCGN